LTPKGEDADELVYRGADKVYVVESDIFDFPNEISFKENIVHMVKECKPEILLMEATNFGRSLAARAAAALETGLTPNCTGLKIEEDEFVQIRPAFTGNILAHISNDRYPKMSTVRYKEFEESDRDETMEGEIISKEPIRTVNKGPKILEEISEDKVNIQEADIVMAGERVLQESNDLEMLEKVCAEIGGKLGASRPLVDEGWIDMEYQVGYSGNRVKPRLYIACGILGAPQHLMGMKESEKIIVINSDFSAPIFEHADYGIVGFIYEVIPELIEKLREIKKL